jgi:hypothetical protein
MVTALMQNGQTQSLNPTVRWILDVNKPVLFCPGLQTLDCFESHPIAALHRRGIMSGSGGAKK